MTSIEPRRAVPQARTSRRPLVIGAVIGGLVLACGAAALTLVLLRIATPAGPTPPTPPACSTTVRVAVDPAHAETAASLFIAYGRSLASGCVPFEATPLTTADATTKGLGDAKAWLPEDALAQQAAAAAGAKALASAPSTPIGWTPLVVVAPRELADTVGRPLSGDTLIDLVTLKKSFVDYGKPEWGRIKLVVPDTQTSIVGGSAFATLAMQASKGEAPPAPGTPPTANQAAMAQAQYRIVEQVPTAPQVLDKLASNPADANALTGASPRVGITTEAAALRVDGVVAAPLDDGATGSHLGLVNVGGDQSVKDFATWLGTDAGRAAVAAAGLHAGDKSPDEAALTARGLPARSAPEPKPLTLERVSTGAALAKTLAARLTILMALDISGSMGTTIPGTQIRRIDLVTQASTFDWDSWPPGSQIGFMTFNTDDAYKTQIRNLVPYLTNTDPAWVETRPMMQAALANIQTGRGTPLFSAIWAAYDFAQTNKNPHNANRVVVLTDGKQEMAIDSMTEQQLLAKMPKDTKAQGIQLILVGLGPDADMATLQRVAQATGATAIQVRDIAQYPAVASQIRVP